MSRLDRIASITHALGHGYWAVANTDAQRRELRRLGLANLAVAALELSLAASILTTEAWSELTRRAPEWYTAALGIDAPPRLMLAMVLLLFATPHALIARDALRGEIWRLVRDSLSPGWRWAQRRADIARHAMRCVACGYGMADAEPRIGEGVTCPECGRRR